MIGIFGGTFDPVHFGHLRTAVEFKQLAHCRKVLMIPSARPPLRGAPGATAQMRAEMLALALADVPEIEPDNRELHRQGPSYTLHTVRELGAEYAGEGLCLLLGSDAFLNFTSWHRWEEILRLCHLAVALRPGYQLTRQLRDQADLVERYTDQVCRLEQQAAGNILLLTLTQLEISASRIRELIRVGAGARFLTPQPVLEYIRERNLYHDG